MTDCNCNHFSLTDGSSVIFDAGVSVGIGTSSPEEPLHVVGEALIAGLNARLVLGRSDGADPASSKTWQLDNSNNDLRIYQQPTLTTVGTVYMVIKDGGNVGIGTQTPTALLSVAGTISYDSGASGAVGLVDNDNHFIRSNGAGAQVFANNWGIASQGWIFRDDAHGADRVAIQSAGNVGIGTDSPTQLLHVEGGSLYINGGNILVSGDVTTGVGAFYAVNTKVADSGGCYYGN